MDWEEMGIIIKSIVEMKIYYNFTDQDVEVISDSYKFEYPPEFEGAVIEVQSKMIIPKDVEVDVGCGNAFGGTNEDEEAGGANNNEPVQKVNDLIDGFKYEETNMDKPAFQAYIKDYLKKMMDEKKIAENRVANFKKGCTAFVKFVLSKFADFTFYTPSDFSLEGALIYSMYKNEEDEAPVFYIILEGLPSFKV